MGTSFLRRKKKIRSHTSRHRRAMTMTCVLTPSSLSYSIKYILSNIRYILKKKKEEEEKLNAPLNRDTLLRETSNPYGLYVVVTSDFLEEGGEGGSEL